MAAFEFYIRAFHELETCRRSTGMGLSPIPFTDIINYVNIFNVEDVETFIHVIRVMDDTLIRLESKKADKPKEKVSGKTSDKKDSNKV